MYTICMENETKLVRKNIVITQGLNEKVEKIRKEMEMKPTNFFTAVVELAINQLYNKTFPAYVASRNISAAKTPEDRAEQQMEIMRIKKEKEEEVLLGIANRLDGQVFVNDSGHKSVKFFNYDKNSRFEQTIPLRMMNEELVKDQYYPSREDVEQRQVEGKCSYKVGTREY